MTAIESIGNALGNKTFSKLATGTAGAVYVMTGIKAIARPAFIMADKNTDAEKKKYSAANEFLYQVLCLGLTVAAIPLFKKGGFKFAEKYLKGYETKFLDEGFAVLKKEAEEKAQKTGKAVKEIVKPEKLNQKFFEKGAEVILKPYKDVCNVIEHEKLNKERGLAFDSKKLENAEKLKTKLQSIADAANKGKGGIELGSFVGSILGLTIVAPWIGHALTHPILEVLGFNKKESTNPALEKLQQPILSEGHHKKVDTNV